MKPRPLLGGRRRRHDARREPPEQVLGSGASSRPSRPPVRVLGGRQQVDHEQPARLARLDTSQLAGPRAYRRCRLGGEPLEHRRRVGRRVGARQQSHLQPQRAARQPGQRRKEHPSGHRSSSRLSALCASPVRSGRQAPPLPRRSCSWKSSARWQDDACPTQLRANEAEEVAVTKGGSASRECASSVSTTTDGSEGSDGASRPAASTRTRKRCPTSAARPCTATEGGTALCTATRQPAAAAAAAVAAADETATTAASAAAAACRGSESTSTTYVSHSGSSSVGSSSSTASHPEAPPPPRRGTGGCGRAGLPFASPLPLPRPHASLAAAGNEGDGDDRAAARGASPSTGLRTRATAARVAGGGGGGGGSTSAAQKSHALHLQYCGAQGSGG
eukprot:scaffold14044_cov52-Phaeocystis_antarctica.AAC.5